jgi:hypothetical protein
MAKKDKTKLPKKVGGVKLPKKLRKSVSDLASNPLAREVVSAALVAGAAALATRKTKAAADHAAPRKQGNDLGNLIAQGVAAFVANIGKPAEKKPEEAPKPAEAPHTAKPKPKQ